VVPWNPISTFLTLGHETDPPYFLENQMPRDNVLPTRDPPAFMCFNGATPPVQMKAEHLRKTPTQLPQTRLKSALSVIKFRSWHFREPTHLHSSPYGMHLEEIPNQVLMVHAVASSRSQAQNENVAIATINPLPGNPLNFLVVREVLREFLVDRQHVHITNI
jgi:hypothetical protein